MNSYTRKTITSQITSLSATRKWHSVFKKGQNKEEFPKKDSLRQTQSKKQKKSEVLLFITNLLYYIKWYRGDLENQRTFCSYETNVSNLSLSSCCENLSQSFWFPIFEMTVVKTLQCVAVLKPFFFKFDKILRKNLTRFGFHSKIHQCSLNNGIESIRPSDGNIAPGLFFRSTDK